MAIENRPENGGAQPQVVAQQGFSRRRLLAVAGATVLAEACGASTQSPTPTQATGADIHAATGQSMGSGITGFETTRPPWVDLERKYTMGIEGQREAARRHGRDSYSKDPANWKINPEGGAMLKPVSQGVPFVSLVSTGDTVAEVWLEVPQRRENTTFNAVVFVVPADVEIPIRGGTFWPFGRTRNREGVAQVKWDVTQKELVGRNGNPPEQPGVKIFEICPPGAPVPAGPGK